MQSGLHTHFLLLDLVIWGLMNSFIFYLQENPCKHPVVILKGVSFQELQAVVQFMYNGQVNVSQERLPSFLQTAEILQIKGLTDSASDKEETVSPIAPVKVRI